MKILVAYYSETNNTQKVAQAIYDGLENVEKQIAPISEAQALDGYDLVFAGFPVIASTVPGKMESFLKSIPQNTFVALFATHGSLRGGPLARTAFEYGTTLPKGKVLGTFGCRGKVKRSVIDALLQKAEHKAWAEEAQSAATHPNEDDFADASKFAANMLVKAAGNR
jgi:flavodoxin